MGRAHKGGHFARLCERTGQAGTLGEKKRGWKGTLEQRTIETLVHA